MSDYVLKTDRLLLRQWRNEDLLPFAELNADPRVMEYFPSVKSHQETLEEFTRIKNECVNNGWGLWAASLIEDGSFIGFIGLNQVELPVPFTPTIEIGWRLAFSHWGKGYATEGAKAALQYGFSNLKLDEIIAYTALNNTRSRHVMEKLGMVHDKKGDFDLNSPKLPLNHPLQNQVLYRIRCGHFTEVSQLPPENFKPIFEVAACYIEINGKILLMKRSSSSAEGNTWGVAAGKMEAGETPKEGAIRELFEETGIAITPSQIEEIGTVYMRKPRGDYAYHMFQVHLDHKPSVHLSNEHTEYLFASQEEIKTLNLAGGAKEALDYYMQKKK